jgi:hypothetical protein
LQSTAALKKWFEKHHPLLKDPSAKVIFVTNMSREENGSWNGYAGIDVLNEVRKYDAAAPILFYVGDKSKTMVKLKEKKVGMKGVDIGCARQEARDFILRKMKED